MKYTRKSIIERYNAGEEMNIIPFWGHTPNPKKMTKACFSQWYDCQFDLFGESYHTAEQYMMAQKASLFKDWTTWNKIMDADDPRAYKALGREVRNFDPERWDREKYRIVLMGNLAKFSMNPELLAYLLDSGDSVLVEGSPFDDVWGVKMGTDDPRIKNPNEWLGENLLGFALMETRDILREWADCRWDGDGEDQVDWNWFEDQYHKDGDDPDTTWYPSTGFIRKDGKWGLLKNDGSEIGRKELIVFLPQWDRCEDMGTGYSFADPVDVEIFHTDYRYNSCIARLNNVFYFVRVCSERKYGVVDTAGRIITPCKWDEIDGYGNARRGDKWGFVNLLTGEETVPQWPENHHIKPYREIFSTDKITNWDDMFLPDGPDRSLEWKSVMTIFYAGQATT